MSTRDPDAPALKDQTAEFEITLIEQFIRASGHDPARLHELPVEKREQLLKEAAAHAAGRLAEVESRAHFVHDLHADHH